MSPVWFVNYVPGPYHHRKVRGNRTMVARDLALVVGDFALVARDLALVAGDFALVAGDFALVAGDFALVAGDLALVAGDLALVAGDFALVARDFALVARDLALVAGDQAKVALLLSHIRGQKRRPLNDFVVMNGESRIGAGLSHEGTNEGTAARSMVLRAVAMTAIVRPRERRKSTCLLRSIQ